jgi:queuine/archaeosine tRNA-ribosyltransferase
MISKRKQSRHRGSGVREWFKRKPAECPVCPVCVCPTCKESSEQKNFLRELENKKVREHLMKQEIEREQKMREEMQKYREIMNNSASENRLLRQVLLRNRPPTYMKRNGGKRHSRRKL